MEAVDFGRLYERYAPDVMRFALYLTGSRVEAEDITSETFVRAWMESDAIRVGTIKAYLFMIARNLHIDWRRREARRGEFTPEIVDPAPGPEVGSGSKGELRRSTTCLTRSSPRRLDCPRLLRGSRSIGPGVRLLELRSKSPLEGSTS